MSFDPSAVGIKGSLFGFPYTESDADLIIIPMPWDVTTSFGNGTAEGPELIRDISTQLDFCLPNIEQPWEYGVFMPEVNQQLKSRGLESRKVAERVIERLEQGESADFTDLEKVNLACAEMNDLLGQLATDYLEAGKIVGTLGGDHSTPFGLIRTLATRENFGILQIDAHMDLRDAYEGFTYSHASIMYNALQLDGVQSLSQVSIRDYSQEELEFVQDSDKEIHIFLDEDIQRRKMTGAHWDQMIRAVVSTLPSKVYISLDVDGLEPSLCPNTGTPVPGGMSYYELMVLLEQVVQSGREIIGFDISECGANTWDANVAARLLFRLTSLTGVSRGHLNFT